MIEVDHQINAVQRAVGTRVLEAGEARTSTISQSYEATMDEVWDACTNAERIPRWFLPISGDLHVGGRYQLEGNAGGTVETCDPPNGFTATWEFGGGVSWIEVRLTPEGDGQTRFELEHIAQVDDDLWEQYGPGATGVGWDLALIGLRLHLGGAETVDPEEVAKWSVSDDGLRFAALSSERWGDANVAAGTPEAQARAAQARSTAFYTEVPPEDAG